MPAYLVPWLSNRTSREVGRAPRALRQGPHRAPAAAEAPPADPAQGAFGPELERAPAGPADMPPAAVGAPPPKRAPPSKCDAVAVGPCPTGCRYPAFSASGCRRHVSTSPATDRKHWGWRRRPWIWQRLHPSHHRRAEPSYGGPRCMTRAGSTLADLVTSFFVRHLAAERAASTHTIASYRDTFRLL